MNFFQTLSCTWDFFLKTCVCMIFFPPCNFLHHIFFLNYAYAVQLVGKILIAKIMIFPHVTDIILNVKSMTEMISIAQVVTV